jgi:purine-binding chemotaxis protein CheW
VTIAHHHAAEPAPAAARDLVGDGLANVRQLLTFAIGTEAFAVDILRVQEIRGWTEPTRIPHAPPYLKGVVNLRGTVVPIIDLRSRFGLPELEATKTTVVIVLHLEGTTRSRRIGIVVDAVSDVQDIDPASIRPAAELDSGSPLVAGLIAEEDRFLVVLNVDEIIPAHILAEKVTP